MIIEVNLDSMAAKAASLRGQTVATLRALTAETTAVADGSVPAAGESADLQVFSTRLSGVATVTLPNAIQAVESFADGIDAARGNYAQAQETAITRALLL
ncbi:MAG: hypothetical protein ACI4O7_11755 [Aristaeellaceae bacterium]